MDSRATKKTKTETVAVAVHPLDLFALHRPDFKELAKRHISLAPFVRGRTLDFDDPRALAALSTALLLEYFQLKVRIPPDRLCPTIPSRLSYVIFVHELLSSPPSSVRVDAELKTYRGLGGTSTIRGIDIGTGATGIYALLGARIFGWHVTASELDPVSLASAHANVEANSLSSLIELVQAESSSWAVAECFREKDKQMHFCMCNPPFFEDTSQIGLHPTRDTPMTSSEATTDGGELAFVGRIVDQSSVLKTQIQWYTSLCGHKSTLRALEAKLKRMGVAQIRKRTLGQGTTKRWVLAWTYTVEETLLRSPMQLNRRKDEVEEVYKSLRGWLDDQGLLFRENASAWQLGGRLEGSFEFRVELVASQQDQLVVIVTREMTQDASLFETLQDLMLQTLRINQ